MKHYGSKSRPAQAHPTVPAEFVPAPERGECATALHYYECHLLRIYSIPFASASAADVTKLTSKNSVPRSAIELPSKRGRHVLQSPPTLISKEQERGDQQPDIATVTSKNAAPRSAIERPPKRGRHVLQSPPTLISKEQERGDQQPDIATVTSKNAAPRSAIERPPKRGRHVVQSPKTIAKPHSILEERHNGCPANEITDCSDQLSWSVSKISKASADLIPAPSASISKVVSTEAFHSGSNVSQKHEGPAKSKLCALPVQQSIGSEASTSCLEQSKINGHHTQNIHSNASPIPAPSILMPARLISQFESVPSGRKTQLQTRSIGIQVEMQPIGDIKSM
jgi:hypothetical protein